MRFPKGKLVKELDNVPRTYLKTNPADPRTFIESLLRYFHIFGNIFVEVYGNEIRRGKRI